MKNVLFIVIVFSTLISAQSDMVDVRDYTPRIYDGFVDLINDGSEAQIGGLVGGDVIYNPSTGRLESDNVGDTYLLRVNITGKNISRGNKCNCGIYMFTGNGNDSVKVAEFDFKFRQRRFETVSVATGFYTLNTFVANYGKIKCDFKATTWIKEVDYWFTRINRASSSSPAASPSYIQTGMSADVIPSLNSTLPLPLSLLGALASVNFTTDPILFEVTPDPLLVGQPVQFDVQGTNTHNNRSELTLYLQRWNGAEWITMETSSNYTTRDTNQDRGTTSIPGYVHIVQASDKYRVQYRLETDGGVNVTTRIRKDGTRLTIKTLQ